MLEDLNGDSLPDIVMGNRDQTNLLHLNDGFEGGTTPFIIEAGADAHSIYVDEEGRVGIGTSTPDATSTLHVEGNLVVDGDITITGGMRGGIVPAATFVGANKLATVNFTKPYLEDYVILLTAVSKRKKANHRPTVIDRDGNGFTFTLGGKVKDLIAIHWVTRVVGEY
jgi:hypothetical protein